MEIRFKIDGSAQDNLTWDDLDILESGKMGAAKNILARFVVDANDQPIPYERAVKTLGAVKISEIQNVVLRFMELLNNAAVNPPTAAS